MKKVGTLILFFLCHQTLAGQSVDTSFLYCITSTIPENISGEQSLESITAEKVYRSSDHSSVRSESHTLPVVVHIVHNNGPENLSNTEVEQGISWLNEAFNNSNYYDPSTGLNTNIQFCLAMQDPENNQTDGITRLVSASLTDLQQQTEDLSLKNSDRWDPKAYINIWIVKSITYDGYKVGGYAYLPYAHGSSRDGIVIAAETLGSPARATTLIHEMGHYLGLAHTFAGGCTNNNCLQDGDRVCDTPPDNSTLQLFPCSFVFNTCSSDEDDTSEDNPYRPVELGGLGDQNDMIDNYMDYTDINCRSAFTAGQSARMHFFIEYGRSSLTESVGCSEPCSAEVNSLFSSTSDSIEVGASINFTNLSTNGDHFAWYVGDSLYSNSEDFAYTFVSEGVFTITLLVSSVEEGCSSASYPLTVVSYCRLLSSFQYNFDGADIVTAQATALADSFYWEYILPDNSVEHISGPNFMGFVDKFGTYTICLTLTNEYCEDTYCEYFTYFDSGDEDCLNGIDDDGDDLIDLFDPDCPCDDTAYQAQCPSDCELIPDSFPGIELRLKWQSEVFYDFDDVRYIPNIVCGDIDNDGEIEVITNYSEGNAFNDATSGIRLLNGDTGATESQFLYQQDPFQAYAVMNVIGQIPDQTYPSIFCLADSFTTLKSFDYTGNESWSQPIDYDKDFFMHLADFNQDNTPELYSPTRIINSETGFELLSFNEISGCSPNCVFSVAIAADVHPHPGLELVEGNKVFLIDIQNPNDSVGNSYTVIESPLSVNDGLTAVADIDGDGLLDVVTASIATQPNTNSVFVWNPRNQSLIAEGFAGSVNMFSAGNGVPLIVDINGDCTPEILVTFQSEIKAFAYNGTSVLTEIYSLPTTDPAGYTAITAFDLNNDGILEIIYRDVSALRIIEGLTGEEVISMPIFSETGTEGPIVADVDNDGAAEILVNGYLDKNVPEYRVFCFESDGEPWAPARSVWNQYGYHVTNVNDDLTIPQFQQNSAAFFDTDSCLVETCPQVYNTFGIQATYRTQKGCRVYPDGGVDLQVVADYTCVGDSIEICLHATSTDTSVVRAGVNVSFYASSTAGLAPLINQALVTQDTTCITYEYPVGVDSLFIVINDEGGTYPPSLPNTSILECDYQNNIFVLAIDRPNLSLDLGPDITRCASEPVVITAQGGFETYLWTDFTTDSTYTAGDDGLHYVEATDFCGRVYRDTVIITTDTLNQLSVSATPSIVCPADSVLLEASFIADSIIWYMDDVEIACINCPSIQVAIDTVTTFFAVAIKDGCFSTDSITVQVQEPYTDSLSLTICESDTIVIYDLELTEAGIYEYRAGTCDTIIQIEVTLEPVMVETLLDTICVGDSLMVEDEWYAESGTYTIDLLAANGCDSLLTLELLVIDSILAQEQVQLCEGDSVMIDGVVYFAAASIEIAGTSAAGCDSVTMVDISIVEELSDTTYTSICEGDSVQIFGAWEDEAGEYSMTFPTSGGCDSSHIVVLSTLSIDTTYISSTICEGDTLFINGDAYTLPGQYRATYTNQEGCDSIVTYEVNITQWFESQIMHELCAGDSILLAGTYYSTPVQFMDTVAGSTCDTVVSYTLSVTDLDTTYLSFAMTATESIEVGATTYDEAGVYLQVESNQSGCDSVLIITITDTDSQEQVFPNIFSPNGDNINDLWQLDLSEYPQNNLFIYDRWGNKMASWTNTPSASWDGTLSGRPVADGVYVFVLTYVDEAGLSVMRSGDVTVVR